MTVVAIVGFSAVSSAQLMTQAERVQNLTKESGKTIEAQKALQVRCSKISMVYTGVKKNCAQAASAGLHDPGAVAFCAELDDNSLDYCLKSIKGRAFSAETLKLCSQVNGRGYYFSDRANCLDYFAETTGQFDASLVSFCFSQFSNNFRQSLGCLNAVRDRQGSVDRLKRACQGRPHTSNDGSHELEACVDEVMRKEPSICAPEKSATTARPAPTPASTQR